MYVPGHILQVGCGSVCCAPSGVIRQTAAAKPKIMLLIVTSRFLFCNEALINSAFFELASVTPVDLNSSIKPKAVVDKLAQARDKARPDENTRRRPRYSPVSTFFFAAAFMA